MKIILDIGHPKDINLFYNVIQKLRLNGHEVFIFARVKENSQRMLTEHSLDYYTGKYYSSMAGKLFGILVNDLILYRYARKLKPDVFVSPGSPYSAHVSKLVGKKHLAFPDTEIAGLVSKLAFPFTDKIYTSSSFYLDLGPKQETFKGYYELAYLRPEYFTPRKEIIDKYGLNADDYIILRISALASHHDLHAVGLNFASEDDLRDTIDKLEKYHKVIIFSDRSDWETINKRQLKIDPKDLHHILYHSALCIGDGASMISESAILGVPAIYVSNTQRGYLNELEQQYKLAFTIKDRDPAIGLAINILEDGSSKQKWQKRRKKMLEDTIDVVQFIVEKIESA